MANLKDTNVVGTLSVNGSALGGGKTIKYQEFLSSGTFTPTAAGIAAGGIHQIFIVGGGERGPSSTEGGAGGEVIETFVTLANTNGITVTIGAGGSSDGADGGTSTFTGTDAGGTNVVAAGGAGGAQPTIQTSGAGARYAISTPSAASSVTTNPVYQAGVTGGAYSYHYALAYQSAYATAYQSAYSYATAAGEGYKGYGAGGSSGITGINTPKVNSGAGSKVGVTAADGYCLVTWYEE